MCAPLDRAREHRMRRYISHIWGALSSSSHPQNNSSKIRTRWPALSKIVDTLIESLGRNYVFMRSDDSPPQRQRSKNFSTLCPSLMRFSTNKLIYDFVERLFISFRLHWLLGLGRKLRRRKKSLIKIVLKLFFLLETSKSVEYDSEDVTNASWWGGRLKNAPKTIRLNLECRSTAIKRALLDVNGDKMAYFECLLSSGGLRESRFGARSRVNLLPPNTTLHKWDLKGKVFVGGRCIVFSSFEKTGSWKKYDVSWVNIAEFSINLVFREAVWDVEEVLENL